MYLSVLVIAVWLGNLDFGSQTLYILPEWPFSKMLGSRNILDLKFFFRSKIIFICKMRNLRDETQG